MGEKVEALYVGCNADPVTSKFYWYSDTFFIDEEDLDSFEISDQDDGTIAYILTGSKDTETYYHMQLKMLPMIREDLTARIEGLRRLRKKAYQEEAGVSNCSKFMDILKDKLKNGDIEGDICDK